MGVNTNNCEQVCFVSTRKGHFPKAHALTILLYLPEVADRYIHNRQSFSTSLTDHIKIFSIFLLRVLVIRKTLGNHVYLPLALKQINIKDVREKSFCSRTLSVYQL